MEASSPIAVPKKSSWLRDKLTGSFLWPITALFLICAVTLPCSALLSAGERVERILDALGSCFNAILAVYLGLNPLVRERNTTFDAIFILTLWASSAAAISAVVLAFFDGHNQITASKLIQSLLGPAQNYIFAAVLAGHIANGGDGHGRTAQR